MSDQLKWDDLEQMTNKQLEDLRRDKALELYEERKKRWQLMASILFYQHQIELEKAS